MAQVAVHHVSLDSGLVLIGEVNPEAKSSAIGFFVKTGSRDETDEESGLSHFLEHMMFKGTETRTALDVTYQLGNLAARANAYTSEETTVYYAGVIPEYFPQMQELLCDMLRPALDEKEFDMEKKVILEEIALYQDRPHYYLLENAFRDYFRGHPAGNPVLGSTESVSALSRSGMLAYFDRRYSPSNMVLCATGNFEWERFLDDAEKYCGGWKGGQADRKVEEFKPEALYKEYRRKGINQSHLLLAAAGPSAQDPLRIPFAVLSYVLGDTVGSKMYWEIVDRGIAESAVAEHDEKDGIGCFTGWASMDPHNVDEVSKRMREIMADPLDFTDSELARAKTKLTTRIVLGGELPMGRLMSLGNEWIARRRIHNLDDTISLIKAVNRRDIEKAVKAYPLSDISEFRLLPE